MKIKIFCDSADFQTIKKFNKNPLVGGFTTNPSLMKSSGAKNYKTYSLKLLRVCNKKPISLEVFADNVDQMIFGIRFVRGMPVGHIFNPMLLKQADGMITEAGIEFP